MQTNQILKIIKKNLNIHIYIYIYIYIYKCNYNEILKGI